MTPNQMWRLRKVAHDSFASYRALLDTTERISRPDELQLHTIRTSIESLRRMLADIDAIMSEEPPCAP